MPITNDPVRLHRVLTNAAEISGARRTARKHVRRIGEAVEVLAAGGGLDVLPAAERGELFRLLAPLAEAAEASEK